MRVRLAGESWVAHSVHVKGVDSFDTSTYTEGVGPPDRSPGGRGPGRRLPARPPGPRPLPATPADLAPYGAVILSDIGANSLLLAPATFERSAAAPNRLASVEQYVRDGNGLLMIGGYLSFAGIEGKARYHNTPVETALPVTVSPHDDRHERPEGGHPATTPSGPTSSAGSAASSDQRQRSKSFLTERPPYSRPEPGHAGPGWHSVKMCLRLGVIDAR